MLEQHPTGAGSLGYANRKVTAHRTGYSAKRLDQLVAEGVIEKAPNGQFDQLGVAQALLA